LEEYGSTYGWRRTRSISPAPEVVVGILDHFSPTITVTMYQDLMPGMGDAAGARSADLLTAGER